MLKETIEFDGVEYDARHGGPFDRGSADSYYGRPMDPHFYIGGTHQSAKIVAEVGTAEHDAYVSGYQWNEESGNKKEWR